MELTLCIVRADWVQLSRKGRYAGEVYLELTWYSNVRPSLVAVLSLYPARGP